MKKIIVLFTLAFAVFMVIAQGQPFSTNNNKATTTKQQVGDPQPRLAQTSSGPIFIDFEGLANMEQVGNYFNGGPPSGGPNYGVYFSPNAYALIASTAGGFGNFCGNPSGIAALAFTAEYGYISVPAGFTNHFSFFYSSEEIPTTVSIWDGVDGTGNLLATQTLSENFNTHCNCHTDMYCSWDSVGISFTGVAKSVTYHVDLLDNLTFGDNTPPPANVPTLSQWGLIILGFMLLSVGVFYLYSGNMKTTRA